MKVSQKNSEERLKSEEKWWSNKKLGNVSLEKTNESSISAFFHFVGKTKKTRQKVFPLT